LESLHAFEGSPGKFVNAIDECVEIVNEVDDFPTRPQFAGIGCK
jgi:hypothetical protein